MGTKRYAAPELQGTVTPFVALPTSAALAVDIFSLGQMLRYMLTGLPPGLSYLEHLEKQGVLLPMLKASPALSFAPSPTVPVPVSVSPTPTPAPAPLPLPMPVPVPLSGAPTPTPTRLRFALRAARRDDHRA